MARERKDPADLSIEDKLKNLYQLQTMLSEIDKIKTLRGELPLEVQDLEDEIEGLTTYENLTKEIEYLQLDNQLNEKKIREAGEAQERKSEEIRRCSDTVTERRTDLDIKKSELDEIISETRAEEEKLRERSKSLEATIEPRLLSAFKRIRKNSRNGLGIVYVQRDACGGCFNKIPPQRQLDIRMRKKIIVCEYCGRIMIDPELAGVQLQAKGEEKPKRRRRTKKAEE